MIGIDQTILLRKYLAAPNSTEPLAVSHVTLEEPTFGKWSQVPVSILVWKALVGTMGYGFC